MGVGWTVDTREPANMQEYFKKLGAEVKVLESGDYTYMDLVGFERKSDDFLAFDRLFSQSHELVRTYPMAFVVVEDNLDALIRKASLRHGPSAINNVLGAVASLCVRGTPPIFCSNQGTLAILMEKIAKKSTDGKDREIITDLRSRQFSADSVALSILLGFPGLGLKRSQAIVKYYKGNVKAILTAITNNPDELAQIEGIGKTTVESIKAVVESKPEELLI